MQSSWERLVSHYGDWERAGSIPWQSPVLQLVSRLTAFTSQLFFAYRCYLLYNRNKLILAGLMLGMSTSLALFGIVAIAIAAGPSTFPFPPFMSSFTRTLVIPALTINLGASLFSSTAPPLSIRHAIIADEHLLATDIAITSLILWKLAGPSGRGIPKTESALRRLRNVTVEAAVPPAFCAILNMITYLTMKDLTHNWFAMMTARFYVWSFMFTLNS
ncbi:hypothetical protein FRC04_005239 [Tulasnella sp. 424]|nr:hypothetical protein FRC04_005239 [Tulasnella sp. 424]